MLNLVASHVTSHHGSMAMVRGVSAMGEVQEGPLPSVVTRAVADVADDYCSAATMVTRFLQNRATSKDVEEATQGRVTATFPATVLRPPPPPLPILPRPPHLVNASAANAFVACDGSAQLCDPAMNGGVLVTVRVPAACALVEMRVPFNLNHCCSVEGRKECWVFGRRGEYGGGVYKLFLVKRTRCEPDNPGVSTCLTLVVVVRQEEACCYYEGV